MDKNNFKKKKKEVDNPPLSSPRHYLRRVQAYTVTL